MKRFWAVLIVVLAVLGVQWWCVDYAVGTMKSGVGSNVTKSSSLPDTAEMRSYSHFAIVAEPVGDSGKDRLQERIAEELQHAILISKVTQVPNKERDTWMRIKPMVEIYGSQEEALKHKPECVIEVKAEEWRCMFLPVYTKWRGSVVVEGTPPSYWKNRELEADGDTLAYCFSVRVMPEARFTGLCSRSHPAHVVASDVAKRTAKTVEEIVETAQEESRERDEKP